ncbi:MAG: membrane or secreted protein containing Prepilin-type cleavage/methylation, partial [Novipirellula sp. JB048]
EVIAAAVILVVASAVTVATFAPTQATTEQRLAPEETEKLNQLAQTYLQEIGMFPRNIHDMVRCGYVPNSTPEEQARVTQIRRDYTYDHATGTFTPR